MRDKVNFMVTVIKYADLDAGRLNPTLVKPVTRLTSKQLGTAMKNEMDLVETRRYVIGTRQTDAQLATVELKAKLL